MKAEKKPELDVRREDRYMAQTERSEIKRSVRARWRTTRHPSFYPRRRIRVGTPRSLGNWIERSDARAKSPSRAGRQILSNQRSGRLTSGRRGRPTAPGSWLNDRQKGIRRIQSDDLDARHEGSEEGRRHGGENGREWSLPKYRGLPFSAFSPRIGSFRCGVLVCLCSGLSSLFECFLDPRLRCLLHLLSEPCLAIF